MMKPTAILGFIAMMAADLCQGQHIETYRDSMGVKGTLTTSRAFHDTILPGSGQYKLRWRNIEDYHIHSYSVEGKLSHHHPEGAWTWEEADWTPSVEAGRELMPLFSAEGVRHKYKGVFKKGLPQGKWEFVCDSVPEKRNAKPLLTVESSYEKGSLQGPAKVVDGRWPAKLQIEGQFTTGGIANGRWRFETESADGTKRILEERYLDGILVEVIATHKESYDTLYFSKLEKGLLAIKAGHTDSVPFVVSDSVFSFAESETEGGQLIYQYFEKIGGGGWQHEKFPYDVVRTGPFYLKVRYPLSEKEKVQLERSKEAIEALKDEVEKRLAFRNLRIHRSKDSGLDASVGVLQAISARLLAADSLHSLATDPDFTYMDRSGELLHPWAAVLATPREACGIYDDHLCTPLPKVQGDGFQLANLETSVLELTEFAAKHIQIVDEANASVIKTLDLEALADEIEVGLARLDSLYGLENGVGADIREKWINERLPQRVQSFAQSDSYEESLALARRVLDKIDDLEDLLPMWNQLDQLPKELKETYTIFAYNPYTGKHDLEMRLKKRLYNDIKATVVPWMHAELMNADTWSGLKETADKLSLTRQNLLDFATAEGRQADRLERKIRRERNVARKVALLNNYKAEQSPVD